MLGRIAAFAMNSTPAALLLATVDVAVAANCCEWR